MSQSNQPGPAGPHPLSEREELDELRKAVAQLKEQRDVLERSAAAAIKRVAQE